jgi:hypothetical protein
METVALRVLRNEPGKFEELLTRQGTVLLSKEGKPFALAVGIADGTLEEVVRLVTQIRAQVAVSEMRADARARGLGELKPLQVDEAIRSYRAGRKR